MNPMAQCVLHLVPQLDECWLGIFMTQLNFSLIFVQHFLHLVELLGHKEGEEPLCNELLVSSLQLCRDNTSWFQLARLIIIIFAFCHLKTHAKVHYSQGICQMTCKIYYHARMKKQKKKVNAAVLCTSKFSRVGQNFSGLKVYIIHAPILESHT